VRDYKIFTTFPELSVTSAIPSRAFACVQDARAGAASRAVVGSSYEDRTFLECSRYQELWSYRTRRRNGNRVMATGHEKNPGPRRRGTRFAPAATNCVSSRALTSDAASDRKWGKASFDCRRDPLHHSERSLFSSLVYVTSSALATFICLPRVPSLSSGIRLPSAIGNPSQPEMKIFRDERCACQGVEYFVHAYVNNVINLIYFFNS